MRFTIEIGLLLLCVVMLIVLVAFKNRRGGNVCENFKYSHSNVQGESNGINTLHDLYTDHPNVNIYADVLKSYPISKKYDDEIKHECALNKECIGFVKNIKPWHKKYYLLKNTERFRRSVPGVNSWLKKYPEEEYGLDYLSRLYNQTYARNNRSTSKYNRRR